MSPSTGDIPPTARQLNYLRSLAEQTGTSFVYPQTRGEASHEIDRLKQLKDATPGQPLDDTLIEEDRLTYATAVQPGEVCGFGSAASWHTSQPPTMTVAPPESVIGERTELARYRVSGGERILFRQRINECIRITDRPVSGGGRSYLVERELEQDDEGALDALVIDYIEQAQELDGVPMATSAVRRKLEQIATDA
jgi:hypothetical protein